MRCFLLTAALILLACGGDKSQPSTEESVPAQPIPVEEPSPVAPAAADAGQEAPDTCVSDCIASRQMQATSPEQIEIDCQKRCADKPEAETP
jgi:hypothetical protein